MGFDKLRTILIINISLLKARHSAAFEKYEQQDIVFATH